MPRWLAVFAALLLPFAAVAQQKGLDIDIIGGNASALPITIVPMPYQGSSAAPQTDVAAWSAPTWSVRASSARCRKRRSSRSPCVAVTSSSPPGAR